MEAQDDDGNPVGVARHRDAPAGDLVRGDGEASSKGRARTRRSRRRPRSAATTKTTRRATGKYLRRPAGRQRHRLHLGQRRGERRHAGGRDRVGGAARAHRAGDRLLVEVRRHAVAAGPVPAGHGDDGADEGRPRPTSRFRRRWRCSRRRPGSRPRAAACVRFVSGGVGGGQIRHVVTFANLTDCGPSRKSEVRRLRRRRAAAGPGRRR